MVIITQDQEQGVGQKWRDEKVAVTAMVLSENSIF